MPIPSSFEPRACPKTLMFGIASRGRFQLSWGAIAIARRATHRSQHGVGPR